MLRFHSKAGADVLMLGAHAEAVLRALGREPAPQGIFLPAQVAAALASLDQAEQQTTPAAEDADEDAPPQPPAPQLRQRAWPLRELLVRAAAEGHPVVWESL